MPAEAPWNLLLSFSEHGEMNGSVFEGHVENLLAQTAELELMISLTSVSQTNVKKQRPLIKSRRTVYKHVLGNGMLGTTRFKKCHRVPSMAKPLRADLVVFVFAEAPRTVFCLYEGLLSTPSYFAGPTRPQSFQSRTPCKGPLQTGCLAQCAGRL